MRILIALFMALILLAPLASRADPTKGPLDYSLKQYGFTLAIALLGGLVSWLARVRKGEAQLFNVMQLVGELTTSAFAGLMAFYLCEAVGAPGVLTAAMTGVCGHMGTRAIVAFEDFALKRWAPAVQTPAQQPAQPPKEGK